MSRHYDDLPMAYYSPMHSAAAALGEWSAFTWAMVILIICMILWIIAGGDR